MLEREVSIAAHQTSHSSGVIHAGVYYEPGSLKARLCVAGAAELYDYCDGQGDRRAPRSGKLIVATREDELERLDELERRAIANGVPGLRRVDAAGIREIEPHAAGIAGLHSPATGVVDFADVAAAFAADVEAAAGAFTPGVPWPRSNADGDAAAVHHARGTTRARAVVACAGAWSDRLARAAGAPADPRIVPFRGGYLRLRPERARARPREHLPGPRPRASVPRRSPHPRARRHGAARAHGADGRRPRCLRPVAPARYRSARDAGLAGDRRLVASTGEPARASSSTRPRSARTSPPRADSSPSCGPPTSFAARLGSAPRRWPPTAPSSTTSSSLASGAAVFVRNAPSPAATSSLPLARLIADEASGPLD